MKSVRLDPELETRLQLAASATGESLSEFIRQAAAQRADTVLNAEDADGFAGSLGVIHGGGGRARRTGSAFADALVEAKRHA